MSKLLSQNEIDALLDVREQIGDEDPASDLERLESLAAENQRRVNPYNFKRPKLFAQDQMRVLNHIHETFARNLSVYLSAQLRTIVDIRLFAIDQVLYSEYVMSSAPPSALYVINIKEQGQKAIFEWDPRLIIFIIEKLFGGPGVFLKKPRELSQIEERIMGKVMSRAYREIEKAWRQVVPITLEESAFESNAEFVQIIPGVEPALVATFEVLVYEKRSLINICYPYIVLEPMLNKTGMKQWMSSVTSEVKPAVRRRFEKTLRDVNVMMRAELGRVNIPLREMMSLEVGDILLLEQTTKQAINVFVGNELKFRGGVGRLENKRAIKILDVFEAELFDEVEE